MPGFEMTRFVDLSEREAKHLICSICLNVFDNAIHSECGHTFCKDCVNQWIADNHKECPECRKQFRTGQMSNTESTVVLGGQFQFTRSLKVNTIISELKTKCNFAFNGCQQTLELGLLSAHLSYCEHRCCKICKTELANLDSHNCLDVLRQTLSDELHFKLFQVERLFSEKIAKLEEENCRLRTRLSWLESGPNQSLTPINNSNNSLYGLRMNTLQVLFGTYPTQGYIIEFDQYERMVFSLRDLDSSKFFLDLENIWELMYCTDSSFPVIVLSINHFINNLIRNRINLFSPENGWFNVISENVSEKYIIVELKCHQHDILAMKQLIQRLTIRQDRHCVALSTVQARQMLDRALTISQST